MLLPAFFGVAANAQTVTDQMKAFQQQQQVSQTSGWGQSLADQMKGPFVGVNPASKTCPTYQMAAESKGAFVNTYYRNVFIEGLESDKLIPLVKEEQEVVYSRDMDKGVTLYIIKGQISFDLNGEPCVIEYSIIR